MNILFNLKVHYVTFLIYNDFNTKYVPYGQVDTTFTVGYQKKDLDVDWSY